MIVFNKSHPAGLFPGTPGKLHLQVSGFAKQQVLPVSAVVAAIDALPSFHLEGLREIIYAPELLLADPFEFYAPRPWGLRKGEFSQQSRTIYLFDIDDAGLFHHILYHEIGHFVFFLVLGSKVKKRWVTQLFPGSACVTPYAARNAVEDFAESYACYLREPDRLRQFPQKFAFMREQVFSGRPETLKERA